MSVTKRWALIGGAVALALLALGAWYAPWRPTPAEQADAAQALFARGQLLDAQSLALRVLAHAGSADAPLARRSRLLAAKAMIGRGLYRDALALLADFEDLSASPPQRIQAAALRAVALAHLQRFEAAAASLESVGPSCRREVEGCGEIIRAHGILASERGRFAEAREAFLACRQYAARHVDAPLEASALLNLGYVALQQEHYDEAVDWSGAAVAAARRLSDDNQAQAAEGNLAWAYFDVGDSPRALTLFRSARDAAIRVGNVRSALAWDTTIGYLQQLAGDTASARGAYLRALGLARQLDSRQDIVNTLAVLAHLAVDSGQASESQSYLAQLRPLIATSGNALDALDARLAEAKLAALRGDAADAEAQFRAVRDAGASQVSMQLAAGHGLAHLYAQRGHAAAADAEYRATLDHFEAARRSLKDEDTRIPFAANAYPIYDDYIQFLIAEGRADAALAVADRSRAQTLLQALGAAPGAAAPLDPKRIAQRHDAVLLFYWLGRERSYVWAVSASGVEVHPMPAQTQIAPLVQRYRRSLSGPLAASSADPEAAMALYRLLVAPIAARLPPSANVIVLTDGVLSELNFETLLVPGTRPHYWIDDVTLSSAPSLRTLASSVQRPPAVRSLFLEGDPTSPDPSFPPLPNASGEIARISGHFARSRITVLAGDQATAAAYLRQPPAQATFIHFVAHAVASTADPLDSAVILARAQPTDASFKLYARDILAHPLRAELVTLSTCYGSGTRSYTGEGLVGLSWAFLHAGAHHVIGTLWDISDASTPALMDELYAGLQAGLSPAAALRAAKRSLLHSAGPYARVYYWAPFQVFVGS